MTIIAQFEVMFWFLSGRGEVAVGGAGGAGASGAAARMAEFWGDKLTVLNNKMVFLAQKI